MTDHGYQYTKPRGPIGAMTSSPGPIYMLPQLIGDKNHDFRSTQTKAPSYSLSKRLQDLDTDRSPGPLAYQQNGSLTNTGESYSPKFTITGIQKVLKFGEGPGPADYDVSTGSKLVYSGSPAYQMGLQLKGRRTDDTPGPNAYALPPPSKRSDVPTPPTYSIAGRIGSFISQTKNPGPSDYNVGSPDLLYPASPKYTMGSTIKEHDAADLPGPLSYKKELVTSHLPSTPKFTMGIKHSQYKGEFAVKYDDDC